MIASGRSSSFPAGCCSLVEGHVRRGMLSIDSHGTPGGTEVTGNIRLFKNDCSEASARGTLLSQQSLLVVWYVERAELTPPTSGSSRTSSRPRHRQLNRVQYSPRSRNPHLPRRGSALLCPAACGAAFHRFSNIRLAARNVRRVPRYAPHLLRPPHSGPRHWAGADGGEFRPSQTLPVLGRSGGPPRSRISPVTGTGLSF